MKKLVFLFVAFAAVSFASCGNKAANNNAEATDSVAVVEEAAVVEEVVAAHEKGCFAWILPWCEEESCYLGSGCGPASHGKSITAFTIHFVKKL